MNVQYKFINLSVFEVN